MSTKIKTSPGEKLFDCINYLFMILLAMSTLLPFLSLLAQSFSPPGYAAMSGLNIIPKKFTLDNYKTVADNRYIWIGYGNTLFRTILGTLSSVVISSFAAYCLSKDYFPHRNFWTMFIVFTMFFSGGMIPSYLLINSMGLINNRIVLILPALINTYNMIIMRNFFQQLPKEIEESGKIDGAGNFRILFSLIYPISTPILATIALWCAVGHWNAWFDCLIYIRDVDKYVLQIVLRRIVLEGTQQMMDQLGAQADYVANPEAIKSATIFFTTLPILCVYPFVQKYFVKGIIVGSLKG